MSLLMKDGIVTNQDREIVENTWSRLNTITKLNNFFK